MKRKTYTETEEVWGCGQLNADLWCQCACGSSKVRTTVATMLSGALVCLTSLAWTCPFACAFHLLPTDRAARAAGRLPRFPQMAARRDALDVTRGDAMTYGVVASAAVLLTVPQAKSSQRQATGSTVLLAPCTDSSDPRGYAVSSVVPFRFRKPLHEAMADVWKALGRYTCVGGISSAKEHDRSILTLTFSTGDRLHLRFSNGQLFAQSVPACTAGELRSMTRINFFAEELGDMGGWTTTGYPLTC